MINILMWLMVSSSANASISVECPYNSNYGSNSGYQDVLMFTINETNPSLHISQATVKDGSISFSASKGELSEVLSFEKERFYFEFKTRDKAINALFGAIRNQNEKAQTRIVLDRDQHEDTKIWVTAVVTADNSNVESRTTAECVLVSAQKKRILDLESEIKNLKSEILAVFYAFAEKTNKTSDSATKEKYEEEWRSATKQLQDRIDELEIELKRQKSKNN